MKQRELILGTSWLTAAAILARVSTLVTSLLIVRWLGEVAFGLVTLAQTSVLMAGGFIGAGAGMAATKLIAETRRSAPNEAGAVMCFFEWATIFIATIAAAALFVGRRALASDVLRCPELADLLSLSGPLLVATAWNLCQAGVLAGLESFRQTTIANAISGGIAIPISVAGIWLGGVQGAIVAQTISTAIACCVFHRQIQLCCAANGITRRVVGGTSIGLKVWLVGLPALLLNAVNAPIDWMCFAIVARQASGIREVGVFNVGNQWCLVLRFLPMMIGAALLPTAARAIAERSPAECRQLFTFGLRLAVITCAPIAIAVAIFSPIIMRWYGADLVQHWPVLARLAVSAIAVSIQLTSDRFLVAVGAVWKSFYLSVCRSGVLIAWLLATRRDAAGLSVARLGAYSLGALASTCLAYYLITRHAKSSSDGHERSAPGPLQTFEAGEELIAA